MTHSITLKEHEFQGPLDLLLTLIEERKLNITDIALAEVTEQFLAYVRQLEEIDPTSISDYLAIAAKLLVIKSRAILPSLEIATEETDEDNVKLEDRLLLYKQFREAARLLRHLESQQRQSFIRTSVFSQRIVFFPGPETHAQDLLAAALRVQGQIKLLNSLPEARIKEAISIQEKIQKLQSILTRSIETKFSALLGESQSKSETIVTFLALLELIKQRFLNVRQDTLFAEITVRRYELAHNQAIE